MRRNLGDGGAIRFLNRDGKSIACLIFVALLAVVFWAAALWFGELILRTNTYGG